MRKIVIPGDLLTDKIKKLGSNVYINEGKIYSQVLGILSESDEYVSVIPLNGPYLPRVNDGIIAVVSSEVVNGYILEYNSSTDMYLPKDSIKKNLSIGDILFVRIKNIKDGTQLEIDNINVLPNGFIYRVSPVKVPRLIGKNESMLSIFKEYTDSKILIGKNGLIWYDSKNPFFIKEVLDKVINNSQKSNLTNTIKEYFEKNWK